MFKLLSRLCKLVGNLRTIDSDCASFFSSLWRRRRALAAEKSVLAQAVSSLPGAREESHANEWPDRFVFSKLAQWFDWHSALVMVKPATLIGWHRAAYRLFWRWKSSGREATSNCRSEGLDTALSG